MTEEERAYYEDVCNPDDADPRDQDLFDQEQQLIEWEIANGYWPVGYVASEREKWKREHP